MTDDVLEGDPSKKPMAMSAENSTKHAWETLWSAGTVGSHQGDAPGRNTAWPDSEGHHGKPALGMVRLCKEATVACAMPEWAVPAVVLALILSPHTFVGMKGKVGRRELWEER